MTDIDSGLLPRKRRLQLQRAAYTNSELHTVKEATAEAMSKKPETWKQVEEEQYRRELERCLSFEPDTREVQPRGPILHSIIDTNREAAPTVSSSFTRLDSTDTSGPLTTVETTDNNPDVGPSSMSTISLASSSSSSSIEMEDSDSDTMPALITVSNLDAEDFISVPADAGDMTEWEIVCDEIPRDMDFPLNTVMNNGGYGWMLEAMRRVVDANRIVSYQPRRVR